MRGSDGPSRPSNPPPASARSGTVASVASSRSAPAAGGSGSNVSAVVVLRVERLGERFERPGTLAGRDENEGDRTRRRFTIPAPDFGRRVVVVDGVFLGVLGLGLTRRAARAFAATARLERARLRDRATPA